MARTNLTTPTAAPRGNHTNLLRVYDRAHSWEKELGHDYYSTQHQRMVERSALYGFSVPMLAGAFAALSPNNNEGTNYLALDTCIHIVRGLLPEDHPVVSYPRNRVKALQILRGDEPLSVLRGLKVVSFYHNTVRPWENKYITVDGHMLNAWIGQRQNLRRDSAVRGKAEYEQVCEDIRRAAAMAHAYPLDFQATTWLVWRRIHGLFVDTQMKLPFAQDQFFPGKGISCPTTNRLLANEIHANVRTA